MRDRELWGLAYVMGCQRFRPWDSRMELALCTGGRVGVMSCHFFSFSFFLLCLAETESWRFECFS